jgi:hypothetical protein
MSIILTVVRSAVVLGVVAVGAPVIGALSATPAAAFCFLRCGGFSFHSGASALLAHPRTLVHPGAITRPALASAPSMPHLSKLPHTSSTSNFRPKVHPPQTATQPRMYIPKHNNDITPGGPSTFGSAPSGGGQSGGGGSVGSSGSAPSGDNFSPGLGGGSGQFTAANAPASNSFSGPSRSLNPTDTGIRRQSGGSSTTGAATSNGANARSLPPLTAVTVCMTRAGSCPMDREIGTACQCKDVQGNVYDGVVQ